ncbi:50S ribosomal protein L3 [Sporolactobacillus spathodeae]|uniref:Large ribosomal subunit protein uL3 n=1 Tax=Sporolactobacillus spathodeae TaxID=1465502 RepID=A0ABS2Q9T7_9BACL|nr:50S ribosomal protein L3 [Sporolactobacillus spathodeae]MBM7658568.1 large subunit ribosomal protein L3 [Sporolactobacillus spathodeae]
MTKGILGKKIGMTQIFAENGDVIPVTVIDVSGNVVLQKKTAETDGYEAVQIGFDNVKASRITKPAQGHAEKAKAEPKRFVKEIRDVNLDEYELGQEVAATTFKVGEIVDVTGTSKGKGYQGPIKRNNQSRGPMAHGSRYHRRPGSMGVIDPAHVFKGKKLAGRMGGETITVQNLEIAKVDAERHLLLIRGNVPGAKKSYIVIKSALKAAEAK